MKSCGVCQIKKTEKDFYKSNKSVCKDCLRERTELWHKNNPKGLKKIQARTRAKSGYKEKQNKYYKEWYERTKRHRVKFCPTCRKEID